MTPKNPSKPLILIKIAPLWAWKKGREGKKGRERKKGRKENQKRKLLKTIPSLSVLRKMRPSHVLVNKKRQGFPILQHELLFLPPWIKTVWMLEIYNEYTLVFSQVLAVWHGSKPEICQSMGLQTILWSRRC